MAIGGHYAQAIAPTDDRDILLENALDLLTDGIALLGRDGRIVYVNEALRLLAERGNDFRIDRNAIQFSTSDRRGKFANAVRQIHAQAAFHADFAVTRESGLPPYTVSVRPLPRTGSGGRHPEAVAMLLIHDPLQRNSATKGML